MLPRGTANAMPNPYRVSPRNLRTVHHQRFTDVTLGRQVQKHDS